MFAEMNTICSRPKPFEFYTAEELWTNEHTAQKMLEYHLNEHIDLSSRNHDFINRSSQWITDYCDLGPGKSVIDFGCGPGLYTYLFAKSGADVTGVDFSQNSLAYAENRANENDLNISYFHSNYLDFDTNKKFDLITMIMCDFCVLSPEQRSIMLKKFNKLLKDDGKLILDFYSHNAFEKREEAQSYERNWMDYFWTAEENFVFLNTFKYESDNVTLDKYTVVTESDSFTIYNWLQYFAVDSLRELFDEHGLTVSELYSDVAGTEFAADSDEMALVAGKK